MSMSVKIAGQSAFFLAGNLFTLVAGFTLQIYLARKLGAGGLGTFGLLDAGVGVISALLGFGIAQTALRHIPAHLKRKEHALVHALVHKGFIALLLSGTVGFVLVVAAMPIITAQRPELATYRVEIIVMALIIPVGMLLFFCSQVLRGFHDVRHIVIGSSFLQLTVKAALAILLIWLGLGVLGYVWAVVLATLAALAWMLFGIRRHMAHITPGEVGRQALLPEWKAYARVMYGNAMLSFWSRPLDRFLLGFFAGTAAVGVLMIVKTLYALPGVFLQMFLSIVAPMMASAHAVDDHEEVQRIYHLCTDWLVRVSLPLVIFLMMFASPVLSQFGERFATEGTPLLQLLLVAQLVSLLCGPVGNVLNMCGLEREMFRISIISIIGGALMLVGSVYLWGITGAGAGVLFTTVYSNFAALHIARRRLAIRWWDRRYAKWILPIFLSTLTALLLQDLATLPIELICVLLLLYAMFLGTQWLIHGIGQEDREVLHAIHRRLPGRFGAST